MSSIIIFNKIAKNVCTILINRPEKRNALNLETFKQLRGALDRFEEDTDLKVGVIGGVGGSFCAGYDLNDFIDHDSFLPKMENIIQMRLPEGDRLTSKLIVAAIEGHAAGVGYELALKCDFRVVEKETRMGFLNRRFGIPIMNGGTVILPELIGKSRAIDLIATGKAQLAHEAMQYGLVQHVSEIGCSLGRAINLARSLVKFDQTALLHDINLIRDKDLGLLFKEEKLDSLKFLEDCGPMVGVAKFLAGKLHRHGSFDMGNLISPTPDVTL